MPATTSQPEDDVYRIQLPLTEHQATGIWPTARSAQNLVATRTRAGSLILVAGDSGVAGQRFSDMWLLQNPTKQPLAWQALPQQQQQQQQCVGSSGSGKATTGSNAESSSSVQDSGSSSEGYTARSNSTAAVVGDWLILFGGWDVSGLHPLAQLEAFNLNSMTWHSPLPAMTPQGLTPQCHDLGVSPCTDTLNPDTQPSLLSPEGGVWGARCSSLSSSCSFRIGIKSGPSPRGQPAAASNTAGTALYLFGGWDGQQRYNDLWKLHVQGNSRQPAVQGTSSQPATQGNSSQPIVQGNSSQPAVQGNNDWAQAGSLDPTSTNQQQWFWQLVQPSRFTAAADCDAAAACEVGEGVADGAEVIDAAPCPRADHVMVCWHYCDDGIWKDILVVFGGSSSSGLLNDTWLFDVRSNTWSQAFHGGNPPCPRSSSAAAITGDTLLLHGGQTPAGVLDDMYLLQLSNLTWIQVDLGPATHPLCRHSMVVSDTAAWIFGGYTGSSNSSSLLQINLHPVLQLQHGSIEDLASRMACCGTENMADQTGPAAAAAKVVKVLNKKASPAPLKLSDLRNADEVGRLPQWKQVRVLHQAALAAGCDMYVDPKTGYSVFTAMYLKERECCGNKCRHCPWGWKNVAKAGTV